MIRPIPTIFYSCKPQQSLNNYGGSADAVISPLVILPNSPLLRLKTGLIPMCLEYKSIASSVQS